MTMTEGVRDRADVRPAETSVGAGLNGAFPFGELASRAMGVVWLWPVLLTFVVGCYQVTRPELWRDELSSWSFASRPVPELVRIVHHSDATQLGYYLLLHFWISAFGDSVLAMRMLSVLAMSGAAACVTLVGRRLAGQRAGLLAGLVFALVPSVSRFAQEVRFYALEVLIAMLATLLLLRALEEPRPRRWAAYAASMAVLGYADLVALCLIAGHGAEVAMRWWRSRDVRQLRFVPAVAVACAACLPVALVGLGQAGRQLEWLARPGLSLSAFSFFGRDLFYSTSAAAALIIVGVLAWAVAWRAAAFATAIAVLPVAVVWLASQGQYSYFFPRYLLLTVGAWALLAGIALSRLDLRVTAAAVLVFGILGAGDQQAIRTLGAHNWAGYPANPNTRYWDYERAAQVIASHARPGDGVVYPGNPYRWEMIDYGVRYYLSRDLPAGRQPREVFAARTAAAAGTLYPVLCAHPASCLGHTTRMWVVGSGHLKNPFKEIPADEAAALRPYFHLTLATRLPGMTVFLLVR
jgi:mannosyltransferase